MVKNKSADWIFGIVVVFGGMLLTLVFLYPGHINGDTLSQYQQGVSEEYGDWHPPLMAFIWHLMHVAKLPIFPFNQMFLLSAGMYWIALASIIVITFPTNKSAGVAVVVIGLFPPDFLSLNYIVKDCFCMCVLLSSYAALLRCEKTSSRAFWLAGVVGLTVAVGIRHNAILAVIPFAIWGAHIFRSQRRTTKATALDSFCFKLGTPVTATLLVAAMIISNLAISAALVRHRAYPFQQLLFFDLVGISVATEKDLLPPDYPFPEAQTGAARMPVMKELYHPETLYTLYWDGLEVDRIKRPRFPQIVAQSQADSLCRSWLAAVSRYPDIYLYNRLKVMKAALSTKRYDDEGDDPSPREYLYLPAVALVNLHLFFLTCGWPYLALQIVLGILQAAGRIKLSGSNLALWGSAFMYTAGYFFVAVGYESRYMFWPILSTTLLLARLTGQYMRYKS